MKGFLSLFCAFSLLFTCADTHSQFVAQCSSTSPSHSDTNTSPSFFTDKTGWTEDISQREENSASWVHEDGRVFMEFSKEPINFFKEGKLERIVPELSLGTDGWIADRLPNTLHIAKNGMLKTAYGTENMISYHGDPLINGKRAKMNVVSKDEKTLVAENVIVGIDKEFSILKYGVKTHYTLRENLQIQGEFLEITETITLPADAIVIEDNNFGTKESGRWRGNLLVMIKDKVIGYIGAPFCFDNTSNSEIGSYSWKKLKAPNEWQVTTYISREWLNAVTTNYPVIIDPLITGPLAEYGPTFVPACVIPDWGIDSILVNIPGTITVTDFYVTASYFADPLAGAVKGDGAMYFSTNCGTEGPFEVVGPSADTAGFGILVNYNMRVPLLCCYDPSCFEQNFYLTMHIGRYTPAGDCNSTFVYYTPFTQWPFMAFIEGHTVEKYGPGWTVASAPICSNVCEFEGKARIRYGVPPYTLTHPWMTGSVIVEQPTPCDIDYKVIDLPLQVPNCPVYCPPYDTLQVPPVTVYDACANLAEDMPWEVLNLSPAPHVEDPSPLQVCSDMPYAFPLTSCEPDAYITWQGNGTSGSGTIPVNSGNSGAEIIEIPFLAYADLGNCHSDTTEFTIDVLPPPVADFSVSPDTAFVYSPVTLEDASINPVGEITEWLWTVDGMTIVGNEQTVTAFDIPGYHEICLFIENENGCPSSICKNILAVINELKIPNIFTPNGDDSNEYLEFQNLEFFPNNQLEVWNRWGNKVFTQENYRNNWNAHGFSEGTYYYILEVDEVGKYCGYVQLVR